MVRFDRRGQAARFTAEDENVTRCVADIGVGAAGVGRKEPAKIAPCGRHTGNERLPVGDHFPLEFIPVIEARPSQVIIVDGEPERLDQPHFRPDSNAGAANVSGIGWNFRLVEDDVQAGLVPH